MAIQYRSVARSCLARARLELAAEEAFRGRYAALELRMAMEALTYDRAKAYEAEIPPNELSTWQPRKLMELLIEIDPRAGNDSSLSFGSEETPGVAATKMHFLGSEKVLSLAVLKKHYDALGSFLHLPTLKQMEGGGDIDWTKVRMRCDEIASAVEEAVASPVFNITFGEFSQIACAECGQPVRKRVPPGLAGASASCFNCGVGYRLKPAPGDQVEWIPDQQEVKCGTEGCDHVFAVWKSHIAVGRHWTCPKCQTRFRIGLGYFADAQ